MPTKPRTTKTSMNNTTQKMTEKEFKALWKTLPESDRRFFRTMVILQAAMKLKDLHYHLPPPELEERLQRYDCHMLFGILVECVTLLTRTPAVQRVKEWHRRRGNSLAANSE